MHVDEDARVKCPYCGEWIELALEPTAEEQRYIEDCPVCCRPMNVRVDFDEDGVAQVVVESENEA